MEMSFFDAFTVISLRVGQSKKTLFQKGANISIRTMFFFSEAQGMELHTLLRSKRQSQCFGIRVYPRHQQYRLHPI